MLTANTSQFMEEGLSLILFLPLSYVDPELDNLI